MESNIYFDFILKPVGGKCNIGCIYCYYLQQDISHQKNEKWSLDFGKKILTDLAAFEHSRGKKTLHVTWHGGEPLLAGLEWYEQIFSFQSTLPVEVKNSFQTNGTLLTKDWVKFLKSHNATIGISIDGPDFVHDKQRVTKNNKGTHNKVIKAIELCNEYDLHCGVLCVVTKHSIQNPIEILDFFVNNGIYGFDFLPAYSLSSITGNPLDISISPKEYAGFMKDVFNWYLTKDDPEIRIRSIVTVIERLLGGRGGVCTIGGKCCGSFLTIEVDGHIAFCDDYNAHLFPDLGNINNLSISDIIDSDNFIKSRQFALSRVQDSIKCANCPVREICGGGCPRNWNGDTNYFCDYYLDFYTYAYEKLRNTLNPILVSSGHEMKN